MAGTQTERAHERQDRPGESPAEYLERYGRMRLIRRFEQEIQRLFLKGEVHGTTHLSAGQEAVPVGICSALEPGPGHPAVEGVARGAEAPAERPRALEVARVRQARVLEDRKIARALVERGGGLGG